MPDSVSDAAFAAEVEAMLAASELGQMLAADTVAFRTYSNYLVDEAIRMRATLDSELYMQIRDGMTRDVSPEAIANARALASRNSATLAKNLVQTELGAQWQVIDSGMGDVIAEGLAGTGKYTGLEGPQAIARRLTQVKSLNSNQLKTLAKKQAEFETAGLTGEALEKAVSRESRKLLAKRKLLIAREETRKALSQTKHRSAFDEGAQFKGCLSSGSDRVCPQCRINVAAGMIPITKSFPAGAHYAEDQHVGCHCSTIYATSKDQKGRMDRHLQGKSDQITRAKIRSGEEKKGEAAGLIADAQAKAQDDTRVFENPLDNL